MLGLLLIAGCVAESDARLRRPPPARPGGEEDSAVFDTAPDDSHLEETGDSSSELETGDSGDGSAVEACYLGPGRDGSICLPVVAYDVSWGEDYYYPDPYEGSAQYLPPVRFVDLDDADPMLEVAPNFALEEYMAAWKGRWGVLQPHVVERVQDVRDEVGAPVAVNSGYRSPAYNAEVGGVTYSRHQYGDAADLDVEGMSADELADICAAHGADYVATYETGHTHCDWRDHPLDPAFYDVSAARAVARGARPLHAAILERDARGWTAPADGFDEGEPLRRWSAFDKDGNVLETMEGRRYSPPPRAHRIRVDVGRQVVLEAELGPL